MGLAFIYPALPTCLVVYIQKSNFHLINIFCVVIVVKKCRLLCLGQAVFSYLVLHSSKIPLVLATKVTHLRSVLFRQPDGVNFVIRRVYFGGCPKKDRCLHVGFSLYLLIFIIDLRYKILLI